jgi:hypothetical protein
MGSPNTTKLQVLPFLPFPPNSYADLQLWLQSEALAEMALIPEWPNAPDLDPELNASFAKWQYAPNKLVSLHGNSVTAVKSKTIMIFVAQEPLVSNLALNGHLAARFVSTSLVVPLDMSGSFAPFSLFYMAMVGSSTGIALAGANATAVNSRWVLGYDGAVKDVFDGGSVPVQPDSRGVALTAPDAWTLYGVVRDRSGLATFYSNGVAKAGGWADGPRWLQLGGLGDFAASAAITDVSICEVVSFQRAVTVIERQVVEGYFALKFGTQTLLPASHPYYIAPTPLPSGILSPSSSVSTSVAPSAPNTKSPGPTRAPSVSGTGASTLTSTYIPSVSASEVSHYLSWVLESVVNSSKSFYP